ncbi:hypothetical protein GW17_00006830 [Ensete ventricosum]|nr:hypothetical protein GW17_00006830 [Ensete ventricosum]
MNIHFKCPDHFRSVVFDFPNLSSSTPMAVRAPISLPPSLPLRLRGRSSWFDSLLPLEHLNQPLSSRPLVARAALPGSGSFGSNGPHAPSISPSSASSAIDFLTLCHRLKVGKIDLCVWCMKIAIVHDIAEANEIQELWAEYENNSSIEASLVKDFDKVCSTLHVCICQTYSGYLIWKQRSLQVEMILQALEYETGICFLHLDRP